jgi:hypothetical protein
MNFARHLLIPIAFIAVSGCGTAIPRLEEPWETTELHENMEFRIKQNIFCETVRALRKMRKAKLGDKPLLPPHYGVQMQITLTVDESGSVNPSLAFNDVLNPVKFLGSIVPQSVTINAGGTLSSQATRVDTSYSYYDVDKIAAPTANTFCDKEDEIDRHGTSALLRSDLGILPYLATAMEPAMVFHSSTAPKSGAGKQAKIDVYSYEIKFVVITSGSVNPVYKLVNLSGQTGNQPFITQGRTRTHDLVLTFGPGTDKGPSEASVAVHQGAILNAPLIGGRRLEQ